MPRCLSSVCLVFCSSFTVHSFNKQCRESWRLSQVITSSLTRDTLSKLSFPSLLRLQFLGLFFYPVEVESSPAAPLVRLGHGTVAEDRLLRHAGKRCPTRFPRRYLSERREMTGEQSGVKEKQRLLFWYSPILMTPWPITGLRSFFIREKIS